MNAAPRIPQTRWRLVFSMAAGLLLAPGLRGETLESRGPLDSPQLRLDADATLYRSSGYAGRANHPWASGLAAGSIYMEDFQDGALNLPMVSGAEGSAAATPAGAGNPGDPGPAKGWSFGSTGSFHFARGADGRYPRFVGLAMLSDAAFMACYSEHREVARLAEPGKAWIGFMHPDGIARLEIGAPAPGAGPGPGPVHVDHLCTGRLVPLGNDHFAQRTRLGSHTHAVSLGDLTGVTKEYEEPSAMEMFGTLPGYMYFVSSSFPGTAWWSWTAPATGWVEARVEGDAEAIVYTGQTLESLSRVAPASGAGDGILFYMERQSRLLFLAVAGTEYQFEVAGRWENPSSVLLRIGPGTEEVAPPVPPNANLANRQILPGTLPVEIAGTTAGSLNNLYMVWFEWTSPVTGHLIAEVFGADVGLYRSPGVSTVGPRVAAVPEFPYLLPVTAGETYAVRVEVSQPAAFHGRLEPVELASPSHETPETALEITGVLPAVATLHTYRPGVAPADVHSWWKWTAATDGIFEFDFSQSTYYMRAEVFVGSPPLPLDPSLWSPGPRRVTFHASAGETIWFRGTFGGGPARVVAVLRPSSLRPQANDFFAGAIDLGGLPAIEAGGPWELSTIEPGEPPLDGEHLAGTLWWRWNCPLENDYFLTNVSGLSGTAEIFSGTSLATLIAVPPADSARDRWHLTPGTYFIRLHAFIFSSDTRVGFRLHGAPPRTATQAAPFDLGSVPSFDLSATKDRQDFLPGPIVTGYWNWTAPQDGTLLATARYSKGQSFDVSAGGTPLPAVVRQLDGILQYPVREGQVLAIRSTGYESDMDVSFRFAPPPSNDDFANAFDAGSAAGAQMRGSVLGASLEPGEPEHGPGSIWWKWTSPRDGIIQTRLFVYEGDRVDQLSAASVVNFTGRFEPYYAVQAGRTYHFAASTGLWWWGADDYVNERIALLRLEPAVNDTPETASWFSTESLGSGKHFEITGDVLRVATAGPYLHDPSIGSDVDTWWRWRAPADGIFHVGLNGEAFILRAYRASPGPVGPPAEGIWDRPLYGRPSFSFRAMAGDEYLFAVVGTQNADYYLASGPLLAGYAFWALSQGLTAEAETAPNANPSGDGFPNAVKFALGLDPKKNSHPGGDDPNAGNAPVLFVENGRIGLRYRIAGPQTDGHLHFSHSVERGKPDPTKPNGMDWDPKTPVHLGNSVYEASVDIEPETNPVKLLRLRVGLQ